MVSECGSKNKYGWSLDSLLLLHQPSSTPAPTARAELRIEQDDVFVLAFGDQKQSLSIGRESLLRITSL